MIQEFRNYLQHIKGYSPLTAEGYVKDIRDFATWARENIDNARWGNITRKEIDAYITAKAKAGLSPATTNRRLSAISAYYRYMMREGIATENPCRYESRRKIGTSIPNTIPLDDLRNAYDHSEGATRYLLGLLITTGMRIGEVLAMQWEDIDLSDQSITIRGKGNKQRKVYTTAEVLAPVQQAIKQGRKSGKMWGISQRDARFMVYDALRPYTRAKQQSPHAIRHTVATYLAKQGENAMTIAQILGHRHIETTQKYVNLAQMDTQRALTQNSILQ